MGAEWGGGGVVSLPRCHSDEGLNVHATHKRNRHNQATRQPTTQPPSIPVYVHGNPCLCSLILVGFSVSASPRCCINLLSFSQFQTRSRRTAPVSIFIKRNFSGCNFERRIPDPGGYLLDIRLQFLGLCFGRCVSFLCFLFLLPCPSPLHRTRQRQDKRRDAKKHNADNSAEMKETQQKEREREGERQR